MRRLIVEGEDEGMRTMLVRLKDDKEVRLTWRVGLTKRIAAGTGRRSCEFHKSQGHGALKTPPSSELGDFLDFLLIYCCSRKNDSQPPETQDEEALCNLHEQDPVQCLLHDVCTTLGFVYADLWLRLPEDRAVTSEHESAGNDTPDVTNHAEQDGLVCLFVIPFLS
eukprot:755240-Hanusia_phi.AAC.2